MAESTDAGRLALLGATHTSLTAEMLTLNHEVREKVARMETIQRRLTEIVRTQHEMTGE